jgi:hypothetical protein
MTDIIDPGTGELIQSAAEESVVALLTPIELVRYEPLGPAQLEELIQILSDRVERSAGVIVRLYEGVHRAEETYEGKLSDFMAANASYGTQMAKRIAMTKTKEELHELNLAKEKLRYAEELQRALTSKLYGYMNLNKSVTAAYNAAGFGR